MSVQEAPSAEMEKIFFFLSTLSYEEKMFFQNVWFTTTFERHNRFIWEKLQLYLGSTSHYVTFYLLTSTAYPNAFNYWVTVKLWQKDICDMPKSAIYSVFSKYLLSDYDFINIFCQLGWQVAQLFPPLVQWVRPRISGFQECTQWFPGMHRWSEECTMCTPRTLYIHCA
jgi:hypothetical protein